MEDKYIMKKIQLFEDFIVEANRGKVHKAAKQGSYPAVIVVVQDGKVIHQESVSTPEVAPATFNVMQEKYPKALIHLEDKTGKRLFSESVDVNESENYITDEYKVGDKIKTNFGEWEVIETDYAPRKSFIAPFIFKGKDIKRVNIPNPPKTNKNAVGYKVTDGAKYPTIGFLYQYKDITKLATVGVDESVVTEGKGAKLYFDDFKYNYQKTLKYLDSNEKKEFNKLAKDFFSKVSEQNESVVTEGKFDHIADLTKALHFETDEKTAEEMKMELGKKQGEVSKRKQIEIAEYSLRRFRKSINFGDGTYLGVFLPGSYDASTSTLGDGPHKKAVKKVRWTQKKYDQWLEDMASNGGAENAFDMAQNAKNEPGLIDWVKKEFRGDDPMQRIQWDIEGAL